MREQALALVRGVGDPGKGLNLLREYLQALVLRSLYESEAFRPLAFVGGTALRFLHSLPRFSEGLDFSTVSPAGYVWRDPGKTPTRIPGSFTCSRESHSTADARFGPATSSTRSVACRPSRGWK